MFKIVISVIPFFILAATMLCFVCPAVKRARAQAIWAAVLLICASKFVCFKSLGGNAFAPELNEYAIWIWNWAYSGMCILCAFSVLFLPLRPLVKKLLAGPSGRRIWIAGIPFLSWTLAGYGIWNGLKVPVVKELDVYFANLPSSLEGYRIAHLTDIHACAAATRWRTAAIVEKTNSLDADLICLTGDLSDGESKHQAVNAEPVRLLRAKDGVLSVTGNHEYYFDSENWRNHFRRWGLEPLENECVFPRKNLAVAGVPDPAGLRQPNLRRAFSAATNGEFRILLQHRPYIDCGGNGEKVDLQLSGHTHGGIVPVMSLIVKRFNNGLVRGIYDNGNGGKIYVSPGAGQWAGFPIRFFNDSEITLITLRKKR